MILGYAFAKSKNLVLVILIHIFMNVITMAVPSKYQYFGGNVVIDLLTYISLFGFLLWEHIRNKCIDHKKNHCTNKIYSI